MPILKVIDKPKELARYQIGLTCEIAIDSISMALIRKASVAVYETSLDYLLIQLILKVKVDKKFTEDEIPFLIDAIYKSYYYLTLDEIAYTFKKGITGDFKKPYNKLDIETVLDWLHEYDSKERLNLIEKRDHNKKVEAKQLQESTFKEVSKEFVNGMVKKISEENEIIIESKEDIKNREHEFKIKMQQALSQRKKFIDENGNEITNDQT